MNIQDIKLTVDAVVFGYSNEELQLLLVRRKIEPFKGNWALPGGFVLANETLEEAVQRELKEETGVQLNYLEQLYTFGEPSRDPRGRIVSVAFYGLVNPGHFHIVADTDAEHVAWFQAKQLPELAFDHADIVATALMRLRAKLNYEPIGFELLEPVFQISHLEKLYTCILGKEIDRRNFRKKLLSLGVLEQLEERRHNGPGRPAQLYRFNKQRYHDLKEKGMHFEIK